MADISQGLLQGIQNMVGSYQKASESRLDREQREKQLNAELRLKGLIKTKDPLTGEDTYAEDPAFRDQKNYEQDVDFYKAGLIPERGDDGRIKGAGVNKDYFEAKSNSDPMNGLIKTLTVDKMKADKEEKERGTDTERTAATFAKRTKEAEDVFSGLEKTGYNRAGMKEGLISSAGRVLPIEDDNMRKQSQAERNFVNAVLRKESGAAISPSEFTNAEKQYFPRVGDTPETIAQKKQNRMTAIEGLKQSAGRAYEYQNKDSVKEKTTNAPVGRTVNVNGKRFRVAEDGDTLIPLD